MFYSLSPPSLYLSLWLLSSYCTNLPWPLPLLLLLLSTMAPPTVPPTYCGSSHQLPASNFSKSVSSLHTITSESTLCTCSHSTTNLASTNQSERNERARSLGAEQRYQITGNGNGTQAKPCPKGSPKMQQRSRRGSWLFGRKQQQR